MKTKRGVPSWGAGRAARRNEFAAHSQSRLEGLVSLSLGRARVAPGSQLVYVEYVATAPWNRRDVVRTPEIRGLGRVLIQMALRVSVVLGFGGRIGLHSKPAVEDFYRQSSASSISESK